MSSGTGDKLKGMAQKAKGQAKETWGDATNDERVEAEGKMDQAKGHGTEFKGDAKSALDRAGDKVDEKVDDMRRRDY